MQLARKLRAESSPDHHVTGSRTRRPRDGPRARADDYVTKHSARELLARIRAVLRRYQTARAVLPPRGDKRRAYRFAAGSSTLAVAG